MIKTRFAEAESYSFPLYPICTKKRTISNKGISINVFFILRDKNIRRIKEEVIIIDRVPPDKITIMLSGINAM